MSDEENKIELHAKPMGRSGKVVLTVTMPDGKVHTDQLTLTSERSREEFVDRFCEKHDGLDPDDLLERIEDLAADAVAGDAGDHGESSQADMVVAMLEEDSTQLFHAPGETEAEAYASVQVKGRQETYALSSPSFKILLRALFYGKHQKVLRTQSIADAIGNISAKAIYEGEEIPVAIRVAGHGDKVYIDLADGDWSVIEVDAAGWRVIPAHDAPVRFVRRRGMLPLPRPLPGGRISVLPELFNIPEESQLVLVGIFLVACLLPRGPYPILIVNGEQGSAKTTLCRLLRMLVDPNKAPVRRPPKCEQDLMIAASNAWVVCFDNLSGISPSLSDAICGLATGTGFAARQLYSDDSERIFDAARPAILNGIDEFGRSDLLDRAIGLHLPTIPDERRQTQGALDARFEQERPRVLGVLLDGVSAYIRNESKVRFERIPRMADFAKVGMAVEETLGFQQGEFMAAYMGNRNESHLVAVESATIGPALVAMLAVRKEWEGTASELLAEIEHHADEKAKCGKGWPQSGRGMSSALKRLATDLRALGYAVENSRSGDTKRDRLISLRAPSHESPVPQDPGRSLDANGRFLDANGGCRTMVLRPEESPFLTPPGPVLDGLDGLDDVAPTHYVRKQDTPPVEDCREVLNADLACSDPFLDIEGWGGVAREKEVGKQPSRPSRPSRPPGAADDEPVTNGIYRGHGNGLGGSC